MANEIANEMSYANEMGYANETVHHPQRLVMFSIEDNCMFCEKPKGPSSVTYVHLRDNIGFISCGLCKEKMKESVQVWIKKEAFGRVRYLKNSIIKIKRSSGEIDDGWVIDSPYIMLEQRSQKELVYCVDEIRHLQRWCSVDEIIELNPGAPALAVEQGQQMTAPSWINRCVICGIDMGDDNPRQLCGKTCCENEDNVDNEDYVENEDNVENEDYVEDYVEDNVENEDKIINKYNITTTNFYMNFTSNIISNQ